MFLGTAPAAAPSDDLVTRTTAGLAKNGATDTKNLLLVGANIGGVAATNVVLPDRSQHEP